jgi:hypothetical protein
MKAIIIIFGVSLLALVLEVNSSPNGKLARALTPATHTMSTARAARPVRRAAAPAPKAPEAWRPHHVPREALLDACQTQTQDASFNLLLEAVNDMLISKYGKPLSEAQRGEYGVLLGPPANERGVQYGSGSAGPTQYAEGARRPRNAFEKALGWDRRDGEMEFVSAYCIALWQQNREAARRNAERLYGR